LLESKSDAALAGANLAVCAKDRIAIYLRNEFARRSDIIFASSGIPTTGVAPAISGKEFS